MLLKTCAYLLLLLVYRLSEVGPETADFTVKSLFTLPTRTSSIHINWALYRGFTEAGRAYSETKNPSDLESSELLAAGNSEDL